MAGIAKLWKPVLNVTDLDEGERFWSAVSGLSPQGRHGQFSVLDSEDRAEADGWILLQLVPEQSRPRRHPCGLPGRRRRRGPSDRSRRSVAWS